MLTLSEGASRLKAGNLTDEYFCPFKVSRIATLIPIESWKQILQSRGKDLRHYLLTTPPQKHRRQYNDKLQPRSVKAGDTSLWRKLKCR
jgi:hypothetical protein